MHSEEIFNFVNVSFIIFTISIFVFIASLPPLKITAFPVLKHNPNASIVTLGLASYIIAITPSGTLF